MLLGTSAVHLHSETYHGSDAQEISDGDPWPTDSADRAANVQAGRFSIVFDKKTLFKQPINIQSVQA